MEAEAADQGSVAVKPEKSSSQKPGKSQGKSQESSKKKENQASAQKSEKNKEESVGKASKQQSTPKGAKQGIESKQGNESKEGSVASSGDGSQQLSKAQLKAMRREKQEAQRAAKNKAKDEKTTAAAQKKEQAVRVPDNVKADVPETQKRVAKKLEKQQIPKRTSAQRKVRLFNHLQQYEREVSLTQSLQFSSGGIHPAIIRLGLQYAEGVISGSNARCIALLAALKMVINDYSTPPKEELCRDLGTKIKPYISFLNQCRPLSVSMGNAIKYVKWHIAHTSGTLTDREAKQQLYDVIDDFLRERIILAAQAISTEASSKISDGDVILVYSCSSLVRRILCDAHKQGKQFRVIVADSRPKMEGKECLRRLVKEGIKCSYVLINAVSYVMSEATKVFLGAHGLLANGFVMSRVGSGLVSLIAKASNVPVLVCCETYKFCERVQTDSFVFNELGDPDDIVDIGKSAPYLWDWRDYNSLTLLNLVFDFTPPEFVSMVITELGMIPCTSVPVVLRMRQAETNET
ncbi:translation initiation factor eIF-2B subunit delta-like [Ruditapes philippinarum]|uniref:translation initiation factor eIF-2B subunit delta-like n=1 Tax=Ruditapes philippinarum TaxID=129788 RepID=UPI00295BEEEF|nr:translation initiation factor eIF-2B subunit delta-like [Ruditapes philippinarum]XP_060556078.1 translation initiation factor eIF-2B subunit delta-like [Ruditapes philippinarum]